MLNLQDLSITELQAYCDGICEVAEILATQNTIRNRLSRVRERYTEAQHIIAVRSAEIEHYHLIESQSLSKYDK